MIRVLIADDHPFILSGLQAILRDTRYNIVGAEADGAAVLDALPRTRPDLLILDVNMPGRSGIDVLRALRGRNDTRPVILLTASLEDDRLLEALELGVQGLVLKENATHLLLRCLDEVSAGGRWIEHSILQRGMDLKLSGGGDGDKMSLDRLTPRERSIAELVAQGRRNREIAAELGVTEGTVKAYLHKIYEKTGVSNRTELAVRGPGSRPA